MHLFADIDLDSTSVILYALVAVITIFILKLTVLAPTPVPKQPVKTTATTQKVCYLREHIYTMRGA